MIINHGTRSIGATNNLWNFIRLAPGQYVYFGSSLVYFGSPVVK